jgi:hypothetical protein
MVTFMFGKTTESSSGINRRVLKRSFAFRR